MAKIEHCRKCSAPLPWDMLTDERHDPDLCIGRQLAQAKEEIKKLKASLASSNDAWFKTRELLGNLYWHHPAIDNDEVREYYQLNLKRLKEQNDNG